MVSSIRNKENIGNKVCFTLQCSSVSFLSTIILIKIRPRSRTIKITKRLVDRCLTSFTEPNKVKSVPFMANPLYTFLVRCFRSCVSRYVYVGITYLLVRQLMCQQRKQLQYIGIFNFRNKFNMKMFLKCIRDYVDDFSSFLCYFLWMEFITIYWIYWMRVFDIFVTYLFTKNFPTF